MFRTCVLLCCLLAAWPAAAVERTTAVDAVLAIDRLDVETFMMLYDESDRAQVQRVRQQLTTVSTLLVPLLPTLPATEAVMGNAEAWQVVQTSIVGDRRAHGMIDTGYDARTLAELRTAVPTLQRAIHQAYALDKPVSPEEAALLQASELFAVYIRGAASPLGNFSDNNDESGGEDLATMVADFDRQLAALRARHAQDPQASTVLNQVQMKWQFLRGTILRHAQQSTPAIVYRHGMDIVDRLRTLRG